MNFFTRLETRVKEINSLLCVGLDPHHDDLPTPTGEAALGFCLRLIEATNDIAVAYKPNSAFFEALGAEGIKALLNVIASVPKNIPVILDAKRGDISSTAEAYASSAFDILKADAITLNPYLGYEAIEPFLIDPDHAVFLLCKSSNPGAADLQEALLYNGEKFYELVAQLAQKWNQKGNIGLVVGATYPDSLARVRIKAPDMWILAPGIGTQGGDIKATLHVGLREDGLGLLVNVSRSISRSENPRNAALEIREAINKER